MKIKHLILTFFGIIATYIVVQSIIDNNIGGALIPCCLIGICAAFVISHPRKDKDDNDTSDNADYVKKG